MEMALSFNEITLTPVTHQNSLWIRAVELARALGFKREDQAAKIYRAHADEFTPDMAQVVEIIDNAESAFPVKSLLFSLRGCHLLAMFARTPVAKAFRRWVLDVLDKLAEEERVRLSGDVKQIPDADRLSRRTDPERKQLTAILNTWVGLAPIHYASARAQVNAHFGVTGVDGLTVAQVREAIQWVQGKIDALPVAAPAPGLPEAPAPAYAPVPADRPLIYRDGKFFPPHRNRKHVAGPHEKAAFDFWRGEFGKLEHELDEKFRALLDGINRAAGNDLYPHAVAAIGREADTMFSISCLLEGLYLAQDMARASFKDALRLAGLHMRLSAEIAVALNR